MVFEIERDRLQASAFRSAFIELSHLPQREDGKVNSVE